MTEEKLRTLKDLTKQYEEIRQFLLKQLSKIYPEEMKGIDIEIKPPKEEVSVNLLRQEAIRWIKDLENRKLMYVGETAGIFKLITTLQQNLFKEFFNISEEDLE